MTGTLGLFSLVDLFQLLASASRTGRLAISHPDSTALVYFDRGKAVHAEFGELEAEEAVYALFADERGAFEFRLGLPSPQKSIGVGTENLVLEALRRLDERGRFGERAAEPGAQPLVMSRETIPAVPDVMLMGNDEFVLNNEELAIMSQVDGHRSLERIAAAVGQSYEDVKAVCGRLVRTGVLKIENRRPRIARLVTRMASRSLSPSSVRIDTNIIDSWTNALGVVVEQVDCRHEDGAVLTFEVEPSEGLGPYVELGRDALARFGLRVNQTLLVKPTADRP